MNRFGWCLTLVLMLATAHESPAPIIEESTPTPNAVSAAEKPKRDATAKPSHRSETGARDKGARSPFARFEGLWIGNVKDTATATLIFSTTSSASATITIRVSKTGVITWGNDAPVQGWISADGATLNWNMQKTIEDMMWRQTCALQLTGSNSANYSARSKVDGAGADVSATSSGTMQRR
jgi:hypothetical protein